MIRPWRIGHHGLRGRIRVASAALLLAALWAGQAGAWTDSGHRIVAEIASERLTAEARRQVAALLEAQKAASLADVSMWADLAKAVPLLGQPSHVVHMPLDGRAYDPARDCRRGRCALAALDRNVAILGDPASSQAAKAAALAMVVHLVGDLHQPLHTSADTGQRKVAWKGEVMTLHRFWDEAIIAARAADWRTLSAEVGAEGCRDAGGADPIAWAEEGRDLARERILADPRLGRTDAGDLPETHADDTWPIVRERLRRAGCRLALVLNHTFDGDAPD